MFRSRPLIRAALFGLAAALAIGGAQVLVSGAQVAVRPRPCPEPPTQQCQLEQEIAQDLARYQALGGAALVLLALSVYLGLRGRPAIS